MLPTIIDRYFHPVAVLKEKWLLYTFQNANMFCLIILASNVIPPSAKLDIINCGNAVKVGNLRRLTLDEGSNLKYCESFNISNLYRVPWRSNSWIHSQFKYSLVGSTSWSKKTLDDDIELRHNFPAIWNAWKIIQKQLVCLEVFVFEMRELEFLYEDRHCHFCLNWTV